MGGWALPSDRVPVVCRLNLVGMQWNLLTVDTLGTAIIIGVSLEISLNACNVLTELNLIRKDAW